MKITQILMNRPVYFGLSILETSKKVTFEFWCDYVNSKHGEKAKLCYVDRYSFKIYIKTEDIYSDIAKENPNSSS